MWSVEKNRIYISIYSDQNFWSNAFSLIIKHQPQKKMVYRFKLCIGLDTLHFWRKIIVSAMKIIWL